MSFHLNPFMLLGGDLEGTLPNPRVRTGVASTILENQVFAPRGRSEPEWSSSSGGDILEAAIFLQMGQGIQPTPADSEWIGAGQIFARRFDPVGLAESADASLIEASQVFARRTGIAGPTQTDDASAIEASQVFSRRADTRAPTLWNFNKISTASGETLEIPSGYEIVFSQDFTNNGVVIATGRFSIL